MYAFILFMVLSGFYFSVINPDFKNKYCKILQEQLDYELPITHNNIKDVFETPNNEININEVSDGTKKLVEIFLFFFGWVLVIISVVSKIQATLLYIYLFIKKHKE